MKKIAIILILLFLVPLVVAAPPDLPVLIYGKVMDKKGFSFEDAVVSVSWQGNRLTTKTLTKLRAEELGNPNFKGYYRFEINDVNSGEVIRLVSMGAVTEVNAELGAVINKDIVISSGGKSIFGKISDFFSGIFSSDKDSEDLEGLESERGDGEIGDISKLLDYNVSIANESNLSSESMENSNLTGNSNFSSNTSSNMSGGYSGDSEYQEPIDFLGENTPYNKSLRFSKESIKAISSSIDYLFGEKARENKKTFYLTLTILGIILLAFFILLFFLIKKAIQYLSKRLENTLDISIEGISGLSSRKFMKKRLFSLSPGNEVLDAVNLFVEHNIVLTPIISSGKVVGIIEKRDLLKKIKKRDFDTLIKTKIKSVMLKQWISCEPKTKMGDVYNLMIEKNSNGVIVEDKGKLRGVVDYFDILSVFNKADFKFDNPPKLSEAMDKNVLIVEAKTKLYEIERIFNKKNLEYAVVIKSGKPAGIITVKDLISAVKKDLDFNKTKVEIVMSSHLIYKTPGTSVYDAFKIALERRFNQIPIVMDNEFVGIVHIKYLVKVYYDLIMGLDKRIKKEISSKSVIQLIRED